MAYSPPLSHGWVSALPPPLRLPRLIFTSISFGPTQPGTSPPRFVWLCVACVRLYCSLSRPLRPPSARSVPKSFLFYIKGNARRGSGTLEAELGQKGLGREGRGWRGGSKKRDSSSGVELSLSSPSSATGTPLQKKRLFPAFLASV